MDQDLELTEAIEFAADIREVGAACRRSAQSLGFPHFLYGFRIPVPLDRPCQFILSGYPKAWRERYDRQRYLAIDPVLSRALTEVVPFGWDELDRDDPQVAQLFHEAAEYGLCHGLSVPVHGAHGEGGLLSVARAAPLPPAPERFRLFQRAQWLTAVIHRRLRALVFDDLRGSEAGPLTPREREALTLAAEGRSAQVISRDMNIAERTVVFHLNRAEEKLGARRRQQAVARAVALGEIGPRCYPDRFSDSRKLIELPD